MISLESLLNLFQLKICPQEFQGSGDHTLGSVSLIQIEVEHSAWMVTWAQECVLGPAKHVCGRARRPISMRLGDPKFSSSALCLHVFLGKVGRRS